MKKYLMTGVAALAICAAFTSCSKSDELYDQGAIDQMSKEKVTETYNARFLAYIGGTIAPDQDWGFGSTRSVIKPDMTEFPTEKAPAAITDAEKAYVMEWFAKEENKGRSEQGLPFTNFFVQNVGNNGFEKQGYFHWEDGRTEEKTTIVGTMDKLHIGSTPHQNGTEHILDFNANTTGSTAVRYIKDGSALYFGYHTPWGQDVDSPDGDGYYWYFKCAQIDVPGVGLGWYVGLSFYGKKIETRNADGSPAKWEEYGTQRLDYCDDWVLKIVPGETTPTPPTREYTIRVLGEDLTFANSASGVAVTEADKGADFDFNDVVFDVAHVTSGTAEEQGTWIRLMAAGGTLPLYIGTKADEYEVHNMFKVSQTTMVNTGQNAHKAKDPVEFKYSNSQVNAKDIPIIVIKNDIEFRLSAQRGEPASKIAVSNMNFDWADERQSIKERYPSFVKWAQEGQTVISEWWD